jgi:hypothetical protein
LTIGNDRNGNWVVQDQRTRHRDSFANRAEALTFALFAPGNRPRAVIMIPDILAGATKKN